MRILLVSPVAERVHIQQIPAALAKLEGVELTVVAPEKCVTEKAYDASGWRIVSRPERAKCFRLVPLPLLDPTNFAAGFDAAALSRVMKESRPDIIQTWGGAPDGHVAQVIWLKLRACPGTRVVCYGFNNLPIRWARRIRLKWKLLWRQTAGGIEANNEGVKVMREAGFRKPLERIFWGISTEDFRPMEKAGIRERLSLSAKKTVGFVGRFVPEKGLRELFSALCQLTADVQCILIGGGSMRAELELWAALPKLKGRVRLFHTMPPEKLVEYMNCMDALVLPSLTTPHWKEQYGRVIGEAFACGVPVVGSDSGAIPEVIGDAGLIVPEGDTAALAQALRSAIFDEALRARLIPAGLERAKRELSIEVMSWRLLDFYTRLPR